MGVQDLFKILDKRGTYRNYQQLIDQQRTKKYIAVDASIYLNKWKSLNFSGSEVLQFCHHCLFWLNQNLIPVYIFDGPQPILKSAQVYIRKQRKKFTINYRDIQKIIHLCDLFSLPYIFSSGEADILCAELSNRNDFLFVDSEDSDILAFGGSIMYKKNKIYRLADILKNLEINYKEFILFCILLGNSYNDRILPPQKALKLIQQNKINTKNQIAKILSQYSNNSNLMFVYDYFKNRKIEINKQFVSPSQYRFQIQEYNIDEVLRENSINQKQRQDISSKISKVHNHF